MMPGAAGRIGSISTPPCRLTPTLLKVAPGGPETAVDCSAMPADEGNSLNKRAEEVAKMIQGMMKKIRHDLGDEGDAGSNRQ